MARDDRWRENQGIYFGFGADRTDGPAPPLTSKRTLRYVGDRHLISVGPNGSGKSRRLLVPNLVELTKWSILVVDPKGDLAEMTAAEREKAGNKIVVLNPFNSFGLKSDGYNPLTPLSYDDDPDNFADDAMGLAESLIRVEGKEPHFSQSAQELVCAIIMYAKLVLPNASLTHVRKILGQRSTILRDMITEDFVRYDGRRIWGMLKAADKFDCPALEAKASRFADIGPENRELSSVISTALTQTRWLDSPPIQRDLAKGNFDFSLMKAEPWTIYLILPARRLVTHSSWLRLMITSVMQPLMKDTRKADTPVLFMLDEFAQLGHLPAIEQNLGLMRQYGLKLWSVLQDFSQLRHIYGDERWQSFIANSGVIQSFAPQDYFTATEVAKLTDGVLKPAIIRHMAEGFGVLFSDKLPSTLRMYAPYPDALPHLKNVMARDPAN